MYTNDAYTYDTYTHIHIYTYTYTHIHIYTYTHIHIYKDRSLAMSKTQFCPNFGHVQNSKSNDRGRISVPRGATSPTPTSSSTPNPNAGAVLDNIFGIKEGAEAEAEAEAGAGAEVGAGAGTGTEAGTEAEGRVDTAALNTITTATARLGIADRHKHRA
jgi:hypothetical protein